MNERPVPTELPPPPPNQRPTRHPRGRRDRRSRAGRPAAVRWAGAALLVVVALVGSGVAGATAYFLPVLAAASSAIGQAPSTNGGAGGGSGTAAGSQNVPAPGAPFTLLLLGSDNDRKFDDNRYLTQSMILVRIVPATAQVTMLSIPRDLWVPLSVGRTGKIDEAFAEGGADAAIRTVQNNFHVHIDDYAWIGLQGLVDVIDRLGGIDLTSTHPVLDDFYPADLYDPNPYSYSRVAVLPGVQHLDGRHALEYVRSRHSDLNGDFGRSARQQQVLISLREKGRSLNAADLPALAQAFNGEVKTSIGLDRLRGLFPLLSQIRLENITQIVLLSPYTYLDTVNELSVVRADWDRILPLVRATFP